MEEEEEKKEEETYCDQKPTWNENQTNTAIINPSVNTTNFATSAADSYLPLTFGTVRVVKYARGPRD